MSEVGIKVFVDVLSALYAESLEGNVFGFDTHLAYGSRGLGGPHLSTAVRPGDEVYWSAISLECEAPIRLSAAEFQDSGFSAVPLKCKGVDLLRMTVPDFTGEIPYSLHFTFFENGKPLQFQSGFTLRPCEDHHG